MPNIQVIEDRDQLLVQQLIVIWESSVSQTHTFLSPADIAELQPQVRQALLEVPLLYGYYDAGGVQGFLGTADYQIEMLFVAGAARGQGIGKHLIQFAIQDLHMKFVDVNEQNTQGGWVLHAHGVRRDWPLGA